MSKYEKEDRNDQQLLVNNFKPKSEGLTDKANQHLNKRMDIDSLWKNLRTCARLRVQL